MNKLHHQVLEFLEKYRESYPDFLFCLRKRNKNNRLEEGLWFQGTEDYAFVGLYDRSGGSNMTRSIGLVFFQKKDGTIGLFFQIVFNEEKDERLLAFYRKLIDVFGEFKEVTKTKFDQFLSEDQPFEVAEQFLNERKPIIDHMIKEAGLDEIFIDPSDFEKNLNKIHQLQIKLLQETKLSHSKEQYENTLKSIDMTPLNRTPLNQIFFGPPGTGKTYHTIDEAVKIIDPVFFEQNKENRKALRQLYKDSKINEWDGSGQGQIGFCTFHQSFSYEDFVEGIKPELNDEKSDALKYVIEDGIFKKICRLAEYHHKSANEPQKKVFSIPENEFQKAAFWKISLGEANNQVDPEIYDYCLEKNRIALGFGSEINFTGKNDAEITEAYKEFYPMSTEISMINYFKNWAKVGDYVVVSNGNQFVRAIGKIAGDYFYDAEATIKYKHFRKVEWLVKDEDIPVSELYHKQFRAHYIYKLAKDQIKQDFFVKETDIVSVDESTKKTKNFVLIIDEINRGNVSSIFGELITLIETDKRSHMNEEMEVVLPYSKKDFRVPPNLYIIGTMNTADRSIEALDTALRRRFSFREMSSKPELLRTEGEIGKEKNGIIEGIDVVLMLEKINKRIEKLIDKDHQVGHAYFMDNTTKENLQRTFKNKVIPLLEEYFFGDFGKIGLVLGSSFIEVEQVIEFDFAEFNEYDANIAADLKQRRVYKIKSEELWDFKSIYDSSK